jgi:hypothetical protein
MWDLTVPGNNDHDFYVLAAQAGSVAVLVHNDSVGCGTTTLYRVSPADRGSSELDNGLNPDHFPSVGKDGEELTGSAHFGNEERVNDFASSHAVTHGQGFSVEVPNSWIEDNNIEIWENITPDQLEYLIPRELIPEFNEFPRAPWIPGELSWVKVS